MLKNILIKNFKSYQKAVLPLAPLTVLIGANASGKSNAIEAMRMLSWLAQGQRLSSIKQGVQSSEQVVRGRLSELGYQGAEAFEFGCKTSLNEWNRLRMQLSLRSDELHITAESIFDRENNVPLYDLDQPSSGIGSDVGVAYNNFSRGGKKPHITCSDQVAIFTQLDSPASFQAHHATSKKVIPRTVRQYQKWLGDVLFLDPVPARMRDYSFKNDRKLQGDGTNLSSVLHALWNAPDGPNGPPRERLLSFIQSLPEQNIADLGFLDGPRGEVMVKLVETFGGTPKEYDATLLSDGTLRVLAVACAMLSAPEGSLVVIEEIDNGVHPSRARHLLEQIQQTAEQRSLRVVLSTHNPAMLDALPDTAISDVVFCYRDPGSGSSKLVRLQSLPDYPELIAQGTLGGLMTSGILERFVKTQRGPKERKRKALSWLEKMKSHQQGGRDE